MRTSAYYRSVHTNTVTAEQSIRLLRVTDVAERLATSVATVRRLIASGELPARRIGSTSLRIREQDLEELVERRPYP